MPRLRDAEDLTTVMVLKMCVTYQLLPVNLFGHSQEKDAGRMNLSLVLQLQYSVAFSVAAGKTEGKQVTLHWIC